jgi:hypothetical protein
VRLILGISLLLLGVGTLSCRVDQTVGQRAAAPAKWVRTVDGWERTDMWQQTDIYVARLHPLLVAAGQGLVSVLGLVACRRSEPTSRSLTGNGMPGATPRPYMPTGALPQAPDGIARLQTAV